MLALALLGLALTVLIRNAAGNIYSAEDAHLLGVATDLARGKMYDIEERLLKDGFTDSDQSQTDAKPFDDEGWPNIFYAYKVEAVEMPSFDDLQQLAKGHAKGQLAAKAAAAAGSGSAAVAAALAGSGGYADYQAALGSGLGSGLGTGSDMLANFQNSALGGMLGSMGVFGGGSSPSTGVTGAAGGALIQAQYTMFQQILKVSVRKVTLTLTWKALGADRDLKIVCFFTDAGAMDQILNGLGAVDLGDTSAGSGSGTGSGSNSANRSSVIPNPGTK